MGKFSLHRNRWLKLDSRATFKNCDINLAENIIGKAGETWITDLSNSELKELFTFTQEDII